MAHQERLNRGAFVFWTGLGVASFIGFWYLSAMLDLVPKQFLPMPHEVLFKFTLVGN